MTYRDTQLAAYDEVLPTLSDKRKTVYDVIASRPSALWEICNTLRWPVNRVSGRVTELSGLNLIVDSGDRRVNPASGKNGIVWSVLRSVPQGGA